MKHLGWFSVVVLMGCGSASVAPRVSTANADYVPEVAFFEDAPEVLHQAGDFVVFRFSGSYRDTPVVMRQRVVEQQGELIVVDMEVDDGELHRMRLRMRIDGELVSVATLHGDVQKPFGLQAYEALMSRIMLSADENIGEVARSEETVNVAGMPLAVTSRSYRVKIGEREAIMKTTSADGFAWGDVGGEVRAMDGELLYKAEIVDLGHDNVQPVAYQEDGDVYDDYDHFEE